jgi:outer membrane receptor protein involved in Fe transport
MALNKTITIKEYRSLDLRITANNVFNMIYFTSLSTAVNSATFGEVTGAATTRRITVQARFRF